MCSIAKMRGRLKFCRHHLDFGSIPVFLELRQIFEVITDSVPKKCTLDQNKIAMKTCFVDSLEDSLYGSTLPITDSRLKSDGIIAFLKENAT